MTTQRLRRLFAGAVSAVALVTLIGSPATASYRSDERDTFKNLNETEHAMTVSSVVPPKFLKLPFRERDGKDSLTISQGDLTSNDEIPFTGDFRHGALDFQFVGKQDDGYGLPVVAAADGTAYYSYQYISGSFTDPDGVAHQVGWGAGLVVEIQHPNGWVTQYIHLSRVKNGIPYLGATEDPNNPGDWAPTGILQPRAALLAAGVKVKQGDVIGYHGDTGIGYDYKDAFNGTTGQVAPRDRAALPPWDAAQLHFQLYHGRNGDLQKQDIVDVNGLTGGRITASTNPYAGPKLGKLTVNPAATAWVLNNNGQPKYAAN